MDCDWSCRGVLGTRSPRLARYLLYCMWICSDKVTVDARVTCVYNCEFYGP